MGIFYKSWAVVKVRKGTPIESVCTPEQLDSARTVYGKSGYSFKRNVPCEDHRDDWLDRFDYDCPECAIETITYTAESRRESAIAAAESGCDRMTDCWCVDGDTGEIIAAFRMTIERIV